MIFNQQQYMGASIRSFNASLGWGGSTSNLDVNLVADTTRYAPDNFFLGETFRPQEVGTPTFFEFSGFNDDELGISVPTGQFVNWQFGGIVKSYRQDNAIGGSPLFSVSVSDPREILAGTQLILDDYFGSVSGIPNVLNVFGLIEDSFKIDPYYGFSGNFGGMQRNDTGTSWRLIKDAVQYLANGQPFVSGEHYGTFLQHKNYNYTFNFNDFPPDLSSQYRIPPTDSMSLMDFVTEVCSAASYDFYVTLNKLYEYSGGPLRRDASNRPINEIRINTVSRAYLPEPSAIINFISSTSGATTKNLGIELRNASNAKFLLGGNVHTMYMTPGSGFLHMSGDTSLPKVYHNEGLTYKENPIHQFLGNNPNGNLLPEYRPYADGHIGYKYLPENLIVIDTRDVDNDIYNEDIYVTTLDELRAIQTGREDWENYLALVSKFKYLPINIADSAWLVSQGETIKQDCVEEFVGIAPEVFENTIVNDALVTSASKIYGSKFIVARGSVTRNRNDVILDPIVELRTEDANYLPVTTWGTTQITPEVIAKFPPSNSIGSIPLPSAPTNLVTDPTYNLRVVSDTRDIKNADGRIVNTVYFYHKYVVYPCDREGWTPMIAGQDAHTFPNRLLLKHPDKFQDVFFTKKWTQNWKIVSYNHTSVPNIHYRKYSKLKLHGGTDDSLMMNAYSDVASKQYSKAHKSVKLNKSSVFIEEIENSKVQSFYDFLRQYAENYGRKYMVAMPTMKCAPDITNSGIITEYTPTDAGYLTEYEFQSAIDRGWLPNNYYNLTQEDGRLLPYAIYPEASLLNFESLNSSDVVYTYKPDNTRDKAFVKCTVDTSFVYINRYDAMSAIYPKAVVTLPTVINYKDDLDNAFRGNPTFPHLKKLEDVSQSKNHVGIDATYEYDAPIAIPPQFIAIPLRNNTLSYGPWVNVGATGIMEYERDESLVPWNYGGYSGLNAVALSKVSGVALQQQDETGSIEFPGMPLISLGEQLEWLSNGSRFTGPYITDISVDFGDAGIKTNYKMQTWTPKFGKQQKQYEDDVKKAGIKAQQAARTARERDKTGYGTKNTGGSSSKIADFNMQTVTDTKRKDNIVKGRQNKSSHHILAGQNMGEITSGINQIQSIVVTQPIYNTREQLSESYGNKAFVSLDGIIRPYSTYTKHSGVLPHYEEIESGYKDFISNVYDGNFDAFQFKYGHDIAVFTSEEEIPKHGVSNDSKSYSSVNNYRSLGFMNPSVFVGYGRTVEGKPVPNANMYEYQNGLYVLSSSGNSNSDSYADGYLQRPDMWKAGPLDTRWDDKKKMWVAGSTFVEGYLIEDLAAAEGRFSSVPFTSGMMVLCGGSYANVQDSANTKLWDRADASGYYSSGYTVSGVFNFYPDSGTRWHSSGQYYSSLGGPIASGGNPNLFVLLINRSTQMSALSGTYIIAAPMPNGDYRPIWVDCESSERVGLE